MVKFKEIYRAFAIIIVDNNIYVFGNDKEILPSVDFEKGENPKHALINKLKEYGVSVERIKEYRELPHISYFDGKKPIISYFFEIDKYRGEIKAPAGFELKKISKQKIEEF